MDKLITNCEDGSCCCLPPRSTVALISILSMVVGMVDILSSDFNSSCCTVKYYVENMKVVLTWFFQMANIFLLTSSIVENSILASIYVWYTLGHIVMGLCVAIVELLLRTLHDGSQGLIIFGSEVVFLFVISRCLPLVNSYIQYLNTVYARSNY